jgi:hypothetical protein
MAHAACAHQPQIFAGLGAGLERGAQVAVLVHPAQRFVIVGIEVEAPRLQAVGDRDAPDRAARLGEMVGDADRLEHAHRA